MNEQFTDTWLGMWSMFYQCAITGKTMSGFTSIVCSTRKSTRYIVNALSRITDFLPKRFVLYRIWLGFVNYSAAMDTFICPFRKIPFNPTKFLKCWPRVRMNLFKPLLKSLSESFKLMSPWIALSTFLSHCTVNLPSLMMSCQRNFNIWHRSFAILIVYILYSTESLPDVLRFAVHLALFLRAIGHPLPEDQVNFVIKGFINMLIQSSKVFKFVVLEILSSNWLWRQCDIIAIYAKHLTTNMQIEVYSDFLKSKRH